MQIILLQLKMGTYLFNQIKINIIFYKLMIIIPKNYKILKNKFKKN
jgi:hypothetical protein